MRFVIFFSGKNIYKASFIIFIFFASAVPCFAQGIKTANTAAKLNPWFKQADFSFKTGFLYGEVGEFVYQKNADGIYTRLSRLDWNLHFLWIAGADISFDIKRFRLRFSLDAALPVASLGFMEDRDWEKLDTLVTKFSRHPVKPNTFFSVEPALIYRIWEAPFLSAGAGLAFQFMSTSLSAQDGYKEYPPGSPQVPLTGDLVLYKQNLYIPWISAYVQWKAHKHFELAFDIFFAPWLYASCSDIHYQTNAEYRDKVSGWAAVKGELRTRFNISGIHALELRFNGIFVPQLKGSTFVRTYNTNQNFETNTDFQGRSSHWSFGLSLAYCIRIR